MLYIVVALKPEAQAFVDKYRLKKSKLSSFTLFSDKDMKLIVSGVGEGKSREATQVLVNHFDITDDDTYINVGICAANSNHKIGTLIELGTIFFEEKEYIFKTLKNKILCSKTPVSKEVYAIVDMESFGFYDAVIHNPAIKNFHIFKVVSDHFQPEEVNKENTKMLIFNQIHAITQLLKN